MLKHRDAGFSLIELLVSLSVFAILLAAAVPSLTGWVRNERIRTVADALQSGIRAAQSEAQRRSQTAIFFRTTSKTCNTSATASASGQQWQVRALPVALLTGSVSEAVQCGVLTDVSTGVSVTGPAVLCFNASGRLSSVAAPAGTGSTCELNAGGSVFDITVTGADRPLRLLVALGGSIRLCDPAKLITASPDGCPAVST